MPDARGLHVKPSAPEAGAKRDNAVLAKREIAALAKQCGDLLRARDFTAALAVADKILALSPHAVGAHLRAAAILNQANRGDEALARLREVVRTWPDSAHAQAALSRGLLRVGDVGGGLAAAMQAASLEPADATHQEHLGTALMKAGRFDDAAAAFTRAAALDPQSASAQAHLCRALLELGQDAQAREAGLQALELNPDQPPVLRLLRTIVLPGEERPVETKTSLDGQDGFLFHQVDSAFDQMCGPPAAPRDVSALAAIMRTRHAWCAARAMTYRMLIVPERHVLYDDKLPPGFAAQPHRPAVALMRALASDRASFVVYPYDIMRAARAQGEICLRQDVHWTSYGAYLGYRALIASVPDLAPELLPESALTHRRVARVGDMAMWRGLRTREECDMLDPPKVKLHEILSTKTFSTGQVDVLHTGHPAGRRLVLFRTSNATALIPFLAHHFARIVSVAVTSIPFDLLESERPDYVFSELPERYLAQPAKPGEAHGIRLPRDFAGRTFFEITGCPLPLPHGA
jgi:Flp pilus assembly protein TadD